MDGLIETLIGMLSESNAGFVSAKAGKYTIIITDDDKGAGELSKAWDKYAEEEENDD